MLLILEGCNGVGKSHHAAAWAKWTNGPVIRPFRPTADVHFNGTTALEQELVSLGVPVNSYVDDLYAADMLGSFNSFFPGGVTAVLDRSMPSAIAYGTPRTRRNKDNLLALWHRLLARVKVVRYAWLVAPYDVALKRVTERGGEFPSRQMYDDLQESFHDSYNQIKFKKIMNDTAVFTAEDTAVELYRLCTS